MRILCWNINGVRTLPQYHPWYTLKTWDAILEELGADILCFQEMKIQRSALQRSTAVPEHFDAFFSFPVSSRGYSGVAVYTNSRVVVPLKAEEGLTGALQPQTPLSPEERVSLNYPELGSFDFFPEEDGTIPHDLATLDREGRALVVDFGLFVLINVYCPAETSETRLPFKMNFNRLLEERVRILIEDERREVVVIGDINVAADPLDHGEGSLESGRKGFWDHPARAWFKKWLAPNGPMVDAIRSFWPGREGMFTCWNTVLNARETNYGARIDYILVTKGLVPFVKAGDIQADIRGSDHCPIYIDLHDEIISSDGTVLRLKDLLSGPSSDGLNAAQLPPRIAAKFWDEFSGKQTLLSKFFTKKQLPSSTDLSASEPVDLPLSANQSSEAEATTAPSGTAANEPVSSQLELDPIEPSPKERISEKALGKRKAQTSALPIDTRATTSKKKKGTGQVSINSFFLPSSKGSTAPDSQSVSRKPSRTSSKIASPVIVVDDEGGDDETATATQDSTDFIQSDYIYALSLAEADESENGSSSTKPLSPSEATEGHKKTWNKLLAPLEAPLCTIHQEPGKRFTVNKPGPNKGKVFYVCSRPVGPGYDKGKSKRLREEVDPRYRCDFFKWASDVKKSASQS